MKVYIYPSSVREGPPWWSDEGVATRKTNQITTKLMYKTKNEAYETPMLAVEEIAVEKGFEVSGGGNIDDVPTDNWGEY